MSARGHTLGTVWTQSHLSGIRQGEAICAGQNRFGPLTRTTPNSSILTGGSSKTALYLHKYASAALNVRSTTLSMTQRRHNWH
jgi:hypothetical protein